MQTRAQINWRRIGLAVEFFKGQGFEYVEVPWMAPSDIVGATCPRGVTPWTAAKVGQTDLHANCVDYSGLIGGQLIGSAEQGFLALMRAGGLMPGRYVAVSPCFRDAGGEFNFQEFMKVELIHIFGADQPEEIQLTDFSRKTTGELLDFARQFAGLQGLSTVVLDTEVGRDLVADTIEVGSYGSRMVELDGRFYAWTYGTGLAEPRFSQALARQG